MKQFQEDFHNALTLESKQIILDNLINSNPTQPEIIEMISDYKGILQDLIDEEAQSQDTQILQDIDNGKYHLMTCIEDIFPFVKGQRYYVRTDDMSAELKEFWKESNMSPIIQDYIESIKPINWVVIDDGVGTLKSKINFEADLNQYFS
jgi:hypothetical protein